jgi:uncharacterized protein
MILPILSLAAVLTAMLSAIIGMAGGVTLLAIMLVFLPPETVIPLHACVQLISNGSRTLIFIKHVQWKVWVLFSIPAAVGILFGRELVQNLDPEGFKVILAIFILIATFAPKGRKGEAWPPWIFSIAGAIAGTIGMVVGATGPVIAPFFLHANILKEELIATKAVCQAGVHILKIIAFGTLGFSFVKLGPEIVVLGIAVIIGTRLGKTILGKVSEQTFVILYKVVLTAIAIKLLIS